MGNDSCSSIRSETLEMAIRLPETRLARARWFTPPSERSGSALIAAFMAAALAGCAVGEHAEALYLYQNRLLAALTTAIVAIEIDPYVVTLHEITQKANELYEGCGFKNEVQRPCGKRF